MMLMQMMAISQMMVISQPPRSAIVHYFYHLDNEAMPGLQSLHLLPLVLEFEHLGSALHCIPLATGVTHMLSV